MAPDGTGLLVDAAVLSPCHTPRVRPDLICVGDVMLDVAVRADALRRGGDVPGEVRLRVGGSAANAAVWAASTGATVRLVARIGDDAAGRVASEHIAERGVEPALRVDPRAGTGTMLVVHEAGDRSMVADRGANGRLSPDDVPDRLQAGAVLVSGYTVLDRGSEAAAATALRRAEAEVVAVDAASWPLIDEFGADRFLGVTEGATLILANEAEAASLTGVDEAEAAARKLASAYGTAVVKRGPGGAVLARGDEMLRAEPPSVEVIDPTGAGDAFDGVLLASLARGVPLRSAVERACEAGARCAASAETWPER